MLTFPDWNSFYAGGQEIWQYIRDTTTKYNLDEKVHFNTKVTETIWNSAKGKWDIKVEHNGQTSTDEADVLINGAGILNRWRWPSIPGLKSYKGTMLHSANWDASVSWDNKRVAIIGNGSSAIQILPQMQKTAAHITTYIRSPTWISTNFGAECSREGKNFAYTEEEKQQFRDDPHKLKKLRKEIEHGFNAFFYMVIKGSPEQEAIRETFTKQMVQRLGGDEELCAKLIPEWGVGCRRLTPGDGYLEALREENVSVQFNDIAEITPNGIRTVDGEEEGFDIIVCATGFDVSFTPYWDLVGRNGIKLADTWSEDPVSCNALPLQGSPSPMLSCLVSRSFKNEGIYSRSSLTFPPPQQAYLGICAPDMPNYFIFNGPNCPIGHGSLLSVINWSSTYILRMIQKIASQNIKSVTVSRAACDDYNVYTQEFLKRTVWTSGCRSWYKNGKVEGRVTAMYAGSILHYKEMLEEWRMEDFEFEFWGRNRFGFMGNGFTAREVRSGLGGEDLAFYME